MNDVKWFHKWEIAPGVVAPGNHPVDPAAVLTGHGVPCDLTGKSAMDIGCWDGPYTHEMARRGARAVGIDIHNPLKTGFRIAGISLGSAATYRQCSVYDLDVLTHGQHDIVLFLAVWHHLKNPLLALEKINGVTRDGGLLIFEGLIGDYGGNQAKFYECGFGGYEGTWWIPSIETIGLWLRVSGFQMLRWQQTKDRLSGEAVKIGLPKPEFPEALL